MRKSKHLNDSLSCRSARTLAVWSPAAREHIGDEFGDNVDFDGSLRQSPSMMSALSSHHVM
jgi:hypothetical protein